MHCGKEIDNGSRFCTFCGGSQQPAPAPAKKPVDVRWIIAFVWLGLAVLGWILALFLMPAKAMEEPATENQIQTYSLTESTWYQWDLSSGMLYSWTVTPNGTATYGIAGENSTYTTQ
jgi:hypothetical protein